MKKVKGILAVLVGIGFIIAGLGCASYGPKISKEKIPSDISSDVREQIERLYSSDPVERCKAAESLGEKGAKATPAIPFLIGILGDAGGGYLLRLSWFFKVPFEVQYLPGREAAYALGRIGEPAVQPLIAALKDKDWLVRGNASRVLGKIRDPRSVEPLTTALKDKHWLVRADAASALGGINDTRAVEPLITALKDKHPIVREDAALVLGSLKDPRAVEPLIAALKDKNAGVREKVVIALKMINDTRDVEPLIAVLKDENPGVRENAAWALGERKDPRAVEPLIATLEDENSYVQQNTAQALEKITGKNFGRNPAKWQEWWEENKGKFQK